MANREYDYLFKLVIIGNSGVGKSALLLRFADDTFSENYITTIGVDFRFKTLKVDNKGLKLQIWDTAGQERFRTITNAYYKGADAIVIVYDTTSQQSFDDIEKFWLNEIESYAEKNAELLLLGNKSDLNNKQVSTERVQEYASKRNMMFYETSAKTAEGVEEAFKKIATKLMAKRDQQVQEKKNKRKQQRQNSSTTTSKTEEDSQQTDKGQDDKIERREGKRELDMLVLIYNNMSNQQHFIDFVKTELKGVKGKVGKIERQDFMKTLKFIEDQMLQSIQVEKKQSCGEIQLKKTNREPEIKQQKQIIILQQKLQQIAKDSQELKEQNHQLYTDVKKQKHIIKSLNRDKATYEKNKIEWDKKLKIQEELYATNLKMTDNVKHVLNMINEDIDREAVVKAKRMNN